MLDHEGRANLSRKHTQNSFQFEKPDCLLDRTILSTDRLTQNTHIMICKWNVKKPRSSSPWANLDRQKPVAKKFQDVVLNLAKTKDSSSHTSDFDTGAAVWFNTSWILTTIFPWQAAWRLTWCLFHRVQKTPSFYSENPSNLFPCAGSRKSKSEISQHFMPLEAGKTSIGGQLEVTTVSTWKKRKQLVMRQIHDAPLTLAMLHPTRIYNPIILIENIFEQAIQVFPTANLLAIRAETGQFDPKCSGTPRPFDGVTGHVGNLNVGVVR